MANYKGHLLFYLVTISILLIIMERLFKIYLEIKILVFGIPLGSLYSILPDIDAKRSIIKTIIVRILLFLILVGFFLYLLYNEAIVLIAMILLSLLLVLINSLRHRGRFHSLPVCLLLSIPFYFIDPYLFGFAFLGYVSHLVMDGRVI